jgi:hypothetical protein
MDVTPLTWQQITNTKWTYADFLLSTHSEMMAEFREKQSAKANVPMLSTVLKDNIIHTLMHAYIA